MPSLNLSNPFRRSADRPSLKERAAALKATAGRVMLRPVALPAPGSDEARAAFATACREHNRLTQFAHADYAELKRTPLEWWTKASLSRARELGEISAAECARLYPIASERELRMDEVSHRLILGALHALAFADDPPMPAETETDRLDPGLSSTADAGHDAAFDAYQSAGADHEVISLSSVPLTGLFALADLYWNAARCFHVGAFWPKLQAGERQPGSDIAIHEGDRFSGLFEETVAEMALREPQDDSEAEQRREWQVRGALDRGDERAAVLILMGSPCLGESDEAKV